ncbi:alpha/beta hydrolase family protein [Sansalvadorimonas verongulae]|uniref:alpha/beta hydrolase n=1 Tax=Sansalvadorimonas verongulae TaxID=2172824 RepID=UPI0012BBCA8E|nr:alpha/beta hydrolase [Sansalvadorimonas verongulae]MTI15036.1 alpha/beta hydrolase [Sansalvadorimonas verongulae]
MYKQNTIKSPTKLDTALDAIRAVKDIASFVSERSLLKSAPTGDGHTVMVLPGFLTSDPATSFIRNRLRKLGYNAQPWRLGLNLGPTPSRDLETLLLERIKELYVTSGHRISLLGWSLGGVFAREAARSHPEMIRQVITLASPVGGSLEHTSLWDLYIKTFGRDICQEELEEKVEQIRQPIPEVPFTSIYTKEDGIVAWQIAQVEETELSQNVKIKASHVGIIFNPRALYVIADRLAQPDGEWKRLDESSQRLLLS